MPRAKVVYQFVDVHLPNIKKTIKTGENRTISGWSKFNWKIFSNISYYAITMKAKLLKNYHFVHWNRKYNPTIVLSQTRNWLWDVIPFSHHNISSWLRKFPENIRLIKWSIVSRGEFREFTIVWQFQPSETWKLSKLSLLWFIFFFLFLLKSFSFCNSTLFLIFFQLHNYNSLTLRDIFYIAVYKVSRNFQRFIRLGKSLFSHLSSKNFHHLHQSYCGTKVSSAVIWLQQT